MAIRSVTSALALAKRTKTYASGMCLKFVRTRYGVGPRYCCATRAWQNTKRRRTGTPPKGVPVWWTGGSARAVRCKTCGQKAGHVAISDGNGYVISTDVPSRGRVGRVKISSITRGWSKTYRGWSEDINGVRVYTKTSVAKKVKAAVTPAVSLSGLIADARNWRKRGKQTRVKRVQRALNKAFPRATKLKVDGLFGPKTKARYSAWQRALGYRGRAADGIPGRNSLTVLGKRHGGFRVTK